MFSFHWEMLWVCRLLIVNCFYNYGLLFIIGLYFTYNLLNTVTPIQFQWWLTQGKTKRKSKNVWEIRAECQSKDSPITFLSTQAALHSKHPITVVIWCVQHQAIKPLLAQVDLLRVVTHFPHLPFHLHNNTPTSIRFSIVFHNY